MTFDERPTARTAVIGERILDEFIKQKGYIPYYPQADGPHPFDRLIASPDKRRICIVEVKTKCRREAYEDTGINQSHFNDYQHITLTYNLPLFLAFVDCKTGTVYGNRWAELLKTRESNIWNGRLVDGWLECASYPYFDRGIVYFPLAAMRTLAVLTDEDRAELRALRVSRWRGPEPVRAEDEPPLFRQEIG